MEKISNRKIRKGVVVRDKMDKTIVVLVEVMKKHPLYKKYVKRSKKFKAHDETSSAKAGDFVEIMETRPLSKEKRWTLVRVINEAQ